MFKKVKRQNNVIFERKNVSNLKAVDEPHADDFAKYIKTIKGIERLENNSQNIIYISQKVVATAPSDKDVMKLIVKKIKKGGKAIIHMECGRQRKDLPPRIYNSTSIKERLLDHVRSSVKKSKIVNGTIILER